MFPSCAPHRTYIEGVKPFIANTPNNFQVGARDSPLGVVALGRYIILGLPLAAGGTCARQAGSLIRPLSRPNEMRSLGPHGD